MIYTHEHAMRMTPSSPWRPANGTEGELFFEFTCYYCTRWGDDGCDIANRAVCFKIGDPEYPAEWVINRYGQPSCSAFSEDPAVIDQYRCDLTPDLFGGDA